MASENGMGHFEVSAKTADNVQTAINHVIQKALLKIKKHPKEEMSLSQKRRKKSKCC